MKYILKKANSSDIQYIKKAKLNNILKYSKEISKEEMLRIHKYINTEVNLEINDYKIIYCNNNRVGCVLVIKKENEALLKEIYIEADYRGKGIGESILRDILNSNRIVCLWVYKENTKTIELYKKLGFHILNETRTRYYMKNISK